ncbi:aminotransferase class IV [Cohnella faecalis]|uniref:4-amino-4-deoxychorismate lyase n=1 Tax=Cohnella faecalis TaxID=2315694 RepID=A0A398CFP9_9BACL|nr:aminotransferase class IV [Cohnella faecalis]RIE01330.1 4-amino-4-deoxychorismate lyase [Cohnella faecalis]
MIVLLNGQRTGSKEAVISVFDHGFLYGMGLFETFRTYGGKAWLLDRHARRLAESCEAIGITYRPDVAAMEKQISALLEANELADGYIRWSVSAGEGIIGLPTDPYDAPAEIVYAKPLAADRPDTRAGKPLRLLRTPRSTPENGALRLKSFHYMNNMVAKRELSASDAPPGAEGLFLDYRGYLCEGLVSNIFWVSGGTLHTPSLETGPLPGITRKFVIELAGRLGMDVLEGLYRWDELYRADEAFLTNSIQEIVPVTALDGGGSGNEQPIRSLAVGRATARLMREYRMAAEEGRK